MFRHDPVGAVVGARIASVVIGAPIGRTGPRRNEIGASAKLDAP
jgi:hypothetical protein